MYTSPVPPPASSTSLLLLCLEDRSCFGTNFIQTGAPIGVCFSAVLTVSLLSGHTFSQVFCSTKDLTWGFWDKTTMLTPNTYIVSECELLLRLSFSPFAIPENEISALKLPFKRYPGFFYHTRSEAANFESQGAASFISVSDNGVTV